MRANAKTSLDMRYHVNLHLIEHSNKRYILIDLKPNDILVYDKSVWHIPSSNAHICEKSNHRTLWTFMRARVHILKRK